MAVLVATRLIASFNGIILFLLAVLLVSLSATKLMGASGYRSLFYFVIYFSGLSVLTYSSRHLLLGIDIFQVVSGSMQPTIRDGAYVLIDRRFSDENISVLRCRVVAFTREGHVQIKRVAGVPGDILGKEAHQLLVNDERFHCINASNPTYLLALRDEHVPEQHLFMLGDNRTQSQDSRHYGVIHREQLIGVVSDQF
ncbi:signal peptidase I [Allohahella sp. A8]|uniref:signal peptidase I n=1 Tax=Allohahella sp. A8 TaxID=3141461 RepID=UPI003A800F5A